MDVQNLDRRDYLTQYLGPRALMNNWQSLSKIPSLAMFGFCSGDSSFRPTQAKNHLWQLVMIYVNLSVLEYLSGKWHVDYKKKVLDE